MGPGPLRGLQIIIYNIFYDEGRRPAVRPLHYNSIFILLIGTKARSAHSLLPLGLLASLTLITPYTPSLTLTASLIVNK